MNVEVREHSWLKHVMAAVAISFRAAVSVVALLGMGSMNGGGDDVEMDRRGMAVVLPPCSCWLAFYLALLKRLSIVVLKMS
jgi:hypothetical protein